MKRKLFIKAIRAENTKFNYTTIDGERYIEIAEVMNLEGPQIKELNLLDGCATLNNAGEIE